MPQLTAAINLKIIMPELALLVAAFIILLAAPLTRKRIISPALSLIAVMVSLYFVIVSWNQQETGYFDIYPSSDSANWLSCCVRRVGWWRRPARANSSCCAGEAASSLACWTIIVWFAPWTSSC